MVKFLINKPIGVLMTALAVVVLGLMALGHVPVSLMPDIDIPEITVQVSADNMSARELEDVVLKPLRSSLMQTNHLEDIRSEASNGNGIIRLQFTHGTNIDYSFIEVNEKIDRAMAGLPRELDRPRVIKASISDIPVFYLNLTLKDQEATKGNVQVTQQFIDFNRFVDQVIRKRIKQIPEVAMVDINGLISPEIVVIPDQQRLITLGISMQELEEAINKQDIEIGSILVKENQYQYNLRLGSDLSNIRDIQNIYIYKNNRLFQLKDLAKVIEKPQKRTGLVLYNGKEAVSMAIIKQGEVRMSDLKEALNASISQMEKEYANIDFSIVRDQTKLLDFAINNLGQSLLWGVALAFLVMFLFLKDYKSSLLIGISVPVSLIICMLFFHLFHISINIISISGLILGTGLMIDNAIIVIDNITQYREMGYSLAKACVKGTNEVFRPLLSSVLTTCAVFIPLIFLSGLAGTLFYDQAMAITIGLFVSLLVSVTLLPVLYRLLNLKSRKNNGEVKWLQKINTLDYAQLYEKGFRLTMKKQPYVLAFFVLLIFTTIVMFFILPKRQMPQLSITETFLKVDWNEPINVEENKKRILQVAEPVKGEVINYSAQVGRQQFLLDDNAKANTSEATVYLQTASPEKLVKVKEQLRTTLEKNYPKAVMGFTKVDNIFNLLFSGNADVTVRLRNVGNLGNAQNQELKEIYTKMQIGLPGIALQPIAWQNHLALVANKKKMNLYGISAEQLNASLQRAFNEKKIFSIVDNQEFVPVVLGGKEKTINEVLDQTLVRNKDSTYYNVNRFLTRHKVQDLKTVVAGKEGEYFPIDVMLEGDGEEKIINKVKDIVGESPNYEVSFSGSLFKNRAMIRELMIILCITIALLYFILATQFESLSLPIIILLEIPISMAGAFIMLFLFGMSLNLMSMIGIVVMGGIVINDSILKIDTIIQLQKEGCGVLKALLIAGQRRLKPILMTSLTTILALLPVLFTSGMGGELQAPLAVSLIGGMLLGTVVSLYLVPLFYYYLTKSKIHAN